MDNPLKSLNAANPQAQQLAQQIWVPSRAAKAIVIKALTTDLTSIVSFHQTAERQLMEATLEVAEAFLNQAFRINVIIFTSPFIHLSKHMITAYTEQHSSETQGF